MSRPRSAATYEQEPRAREHECWVGRTRAAATSRTVDAPLAKDYSRRMRQRALVLVGTFWIGAALIGHAKERRGAVTCECQDDCWCKKPGVDLFRWVLPIGHRLP